VSFPPRQANGETRGALLIANPSGRRVRSVAAYLGARGIGIIGLAAIVCLARPTALAVGIDEQANDLECGNGLDHPPRSITVFNIEAIPTLERIAISNCPSAINTALDQVRTLNLGTALSGRPDRAR
jgi:hypothetical protein